MTDRSPQKRFEMKPPAELRTSGRYGFWLQTDEKRLLVTVRAMRCVEAMKRSRRTGRVLVRISDEHDPDEAWHWIRTELEEAVNTVELDSIWEDAIKWIL
jgi:hypothetical protein